MRRRFNKYSMPPWTRKIRIFCGQFIIPFCIFQGIRTVIFPTILDVFLLTIFTLTAIALFFDII
ncbi:hypothetical protein [Neobacillus sp. PS3-40]|uniref:hypothetical protein n=1 Tax=Neobacillus sp. PS3-40 TaxID=3070679 RepID=UPI0027E10C12|nr:hypothetical protein [Neobacillus sp. PS3-40]WML45565.1 hypothetical protein RCG20_06585 [Neobacillus sp. PS3-40]